MRTTIGSIFTGVILAAVLPASAGANESIETMARNIIADYKAVRKECAQLPKEADKKSCYYRLRIKQWDYKEAKAILRARGHKELVASN